MQINLGPPNAAVAVPLAPPVTIANYGPATVYADDGPNVDPALSTIIAPGGAATFVTSNASVYLLTSDGAGAIVDVLSARAPLSEADRLLQSGAGGPSRIPPTGFTRP
jgi:hypothetical protein